MSTKLKCHHREVLKRNVLDTFKFFLFFFYFVMFSGLALSFAGIFWFIFSNATSVKL